MFCKKCSFVAGDMSGVNNRLKMSMLKLLRWESQRLSPNDWDDGWGRLSAVAKELGATTQEVSVVVANASRDDGEFYFERARGYDGLTWIKAVIRRRDTESWSSQQAGVAGDHVAPDAEPWQHAGVGDHVDAPDAEPWLHPGPGAAVDASTSKPEYSPTSAGDEYPDGPSRQPEVPVPNPQMPDEIDDDDDAAVKPEAQTVNIPLAPGTKKEAAVICDESDDDTWGDGA